MYKRDIGGRRRRSINCCPVSVTLSDVLASLCRNIVCCRWLQAQPSNHNNNSSRNLALSTTTSVKFSKLEQSRPLSVNDVLEEQEQEQEPEPDTTTTTATPSKHYVKIADGNDKQLNTSADVSILFASLHFSPVFWFVPMFSLPLSLPAHVIL